MKKTILLLFAVFLSGMMLIAQEETKTSERHKIPLIGDEAPAFSAKTTNGTLHFPEDYGKKWKILFSHPLDFTPVCTSELLEMAYLQDEFKELGVKLVVVSTDNLERHESWKESMETLTYKDREPVEINFPLVDDASKTVANKYGMLHENTSTSKDVRGVFIIDPQNIVRAISFNPMEVGRNLEDIKRIVIALQTIDENVVLTPANWEPGDDVLIPYSHSRDKDNKEVVAKNDPDLYEVSWYMVFKDMDGQLSDNSVPNNK